MVIYLGIGVTLKVQPKDRAVQGELQQVSQISDSQKPLNQQHQQGQTQRSGQRSGSGNLLLRIAKKTIIGRLVMAFVPGKEEDVEMQRHYVRK